MSVIAKENKIAGVLSEGEKMKIHPYFPKIE